MAVSIQIDLMLVLVTFDWLTVLCGVMCEEVVRHWLGTSPVGCWFWFGVRFCLGGDRA